MEEDRFIIEQLEKLPFKAKEIILYKFDKINKIILDNIASFSLYADSPIEIILGTALIIQTNGELYLLNQNQVQCKNKNYFIDIDVSYDDYFNNFLKQGFKLAIECDGYEFHQKTKEQVDKDNQREYDLKMCGYEVLRFSGREIFNDPLGCANKIIDYIIKNGKPSNE